MLMAEESSTFIKMILKKRIKNEFQSENKLGKLLILSKVKVDLETIYSLYKQMEEIEQVLDTMKNELENDKSYLSDDALRGYFFLSFLSPYMYCSIFALIRPAGLTIKLMMNDVLLIFSKEYKKSPRKE